MMMLMLVILKLASDHLPMSMCIMVPDSEIMEFRKDDISSDFVYVEWCVKKFVILTEYQLINVISGNVAIIYA